MCRWRHADSDLVLDAMPMDGSILGFRAMIAAVSPPFLVATKLEAFASRGRNDYIASRDMADVVSLLEGGLSSSRRSPVPAKSCAVTSPPSCHVTGRTRASSMASTPPCR